MTPPEIGQAGRMPAVVTGGPGRVLVVDDNELNRDLLVRRLQRDGHTAGVATGGIEALAKLAAEPFDVVLLDIMMPDLDGFGVLERMQADAVLRAVRVVIVSADDTVDSVARGITMGADDYLTKPINPVLLNARLTSALARKRVADAERMHALALERELAIGREIQASFLPESLPVVPGWELDARLRAASQVSGDFYDAFAFEAGGRVGLIVADVCDKGVGAALFMALFRSLLRAAAVQRYSGLTGRGISLSATGFMSVGGHDTPSADAGRTALASALKVTNNYIALTHPKSNMFATVFFAVLDPASGQLDYANCGHEPALVIGPGGIRARLEPTSPAVGMMPDVPFGVRSVTLAPGETLLAFTDGVTEARDGAGELLGTERFEALLAAPATSPRELLERLESAVRDHTGGAPQSDDITLLAARRLPPAPAVATSPPPARTVRIGP
jgi:serine phosphatase RsbU (regulator of sigma subunit)